MTKITDTTNPPNNVIDLAAVRSQRDCDAILVRYGARVVIAVLKTIDKLPNETDVAEQVAAVDAELAAMTGLTDREAIAAYRAEKEGASHA